MILSGQSIRKRCAGAVPIITPFRERTKHLGMTYGLSPAGYDVRIAESLKLEPHGFALASTVERFRMHNDILAIVHDKSTWARRGIALQNTVIEPGWEGFLTLEVTNHGCLPIEIEWGTPIAQIIFHLLEAPTEQPYDGKYQNQPQGAQPAIIEDDS